MIIRIETDHENSLTEIPDIDGQQIAENLRSRYGDLPLAELIWKAAADIAHVENNKAILEFYKPYIKEGFPDNISPEAEHLAPGIRKVHDEPLLPISSLKQGFGQIFLALRGLFIKSRKSSGSPD